MTQLHFNWGTYGDPETLACSACCRGTSQTGSMDAQEPGDLSQGREGAGPEVSADDGACDECELEADPIDDDIRHAFRSWQEVYAEEVSIPLYGTI